MSPAFSVATVPSGQREDRDEGKMGFVKDKF